MSVFFLPTYIYKLERWLHLAVTRMTMHPWWFGTYQSSYHDNQRYCSNVHLRNIWNCWTGYRIWPGLGQFTLNKPLMKIVNWPKPGYASITCSKISNIPYSLIFTTTFNDSSILITIISCDYLNLSLAEEHIGDITIPTQVIEYNHNFLQADQPIRLQYSNQIKLYI